MSVCQEEKKFNRLKFGHVILPSEINNYPCFSSSLKKYGSGKYGWPSGRRKQKQFQKRNVNYQKADLIELAWQKYFINKTPMGSLIKSNSTLESIKQNKGLRLIHVTSSLPEIEKNGVIYGSGGALGACIYGVPLRMDGRLHNFTELLFKYELPNSLKAKKINKPINLLEIYLPQENFKEVNLVTSGIDYVKLGILRINAFNNLLRKYIIPKDEEVTLKNAVVKKFNETRTFLELCAHYDIDSVDNVTYFILLKRALDTVTHLRAIYFEVVSEYVLLFQNDKFAHQHLSIGELYHWNHKKMIFDLCPILNEKFKLTYFNPQFKNVCFYLKEKSKENCLIASFSKEHFYKFLKWRISQYIRLKILDGNPLPTGKIYFEDIIDYNPSFAGHLIHREIHEIYSYEKEIARTLWQYWKKNNIICLSNGILPKGEMGINPAYPNLGYQIFEGTIDKNNTFKRKRELKVEIIPELINPVFGVLRAPHK